MNDKLDGISHLSLILFVAFGGAGFFLNFFYVGVVKHREGKLIRSAGNLAALVIASFLAGFTTVLFVLLTVNHQKVLFTTHLDSGWKFILYLGWLLLLGSAIWGIDMFIRLFIHLAKHPPSE